MQQANSPVAVATQHAPKRVSVVIVVNVETFGLTADCAATILRN
jgi:hypothetical protein